MEPTMYSRHSSFRLTKRGPSGPMTMVTGLVVLLAALALGYWAGQKVTPTPTESPDLTTSAKKETATETPTAVATAAFTSEKYSIGFSYPQTWQEDTSGASLVGMNKVIKYKSTDFSGEKPTNITGQRLEVLTSTKKQTEVAALTESSSFEGYEAVKLAEAAQVGDAKIKIWEYKIDPTNTEVHAGVNTKDLNRVFGIVRIFVSETETYVINFEGRTADDLTTLDDVITSLTFTKKETGSTGSGTKKATPTPLPTNATYFEGQ